MGENRYGIANQFAEDFMTMFMTRAFMYQAKAIDFQANADWNEYAAAIYSGKW